MFVIVFSMYSIVCYSDYIVRFAPQLLVLAQQARSYLRFTEKVENKAEFP